MPPTVHSSFSASASARLLACPGSYALAQQLDDGTRRSTVYSAEGTLAHAIGEACLYSGKEPADFVGQTRSVDGFEFTITDEFADAAAEYVGYVRGLIAMGYVVMLETQVSPTVQWEKLAPLNVDLFGTADLIGYHPDLRRLEIADLKFGAGVPVEVEDNSQFLYYASGAMDATLIRRLCASHGQPYNGIDTVNLTVVQPRAFHRDGPIRSKTYAPKEVKAWARHTLYPGVATALNDGGQTLAAGKHCRFCPALAHCKKPQEAAFSAAQQAFLNTPIENIPAPTEPGAALPEGALTDDELADILDKIEVIQPWLAAVKELAQSRVEQGRTLTGWKLVPKRALRRWADVDVEVLKHLNGTPLLPEDFVTNKPLTPAQIERKVGRKLYEQHVAPLVVKSSSGHTLASEGDPRNRITARRSAQEAFGITNQKEKPK